MNRENRQIVRYARNGRRIVVATFPTALGAALALRRIRATDNGRLGDWR